MTYHFVGLDGGAVPIGELQSWSAGRTSIWLGMVPTVLDVVVLVIAHRAHNKRAHGALRTVVGHPVDDGVAWTTVGAVNEGIAIAVVAGIAHLPKAVTADVRVRRDDGVHIRQVDALADLEAFVVRRGLIPHHLSHVDDPCERRRPGDQLVDEAVDGLRRSLQLKQDAFGVVQHPAAGSVGARQPVDEWPKAYPLHDPADPVTAGLERLEGFSRAWVIPLHGVPQ